MCRPDETVHYCAVRRGLPVRDLFLLATLQAFDLFQFWFFNLDFSFITCAAKLLFFVFTLTSTYVDHTNIQWWFYPCFTERVFMLFFYQNYRKNIEFLARISTKSPQIRSLYIYLNQRLLHGQSSIVVVISENRLPPAVVCRPVISNHETYFMPVFLPTQFQDVMPIRVRGGCLSLCLLSVDSLVFKFTASFRRLWICRVDSCCLWFTTEQSLVSQTVASMTCFK